MTILIEALNVEEDMYGTERLMKLVKQIPIEYSAEKVIQYIIEDVQEFVVDAEQYDDITLVVIKRIPND